MNLAQISQILAWGAASAYTVAFLVHVMALVARSAPARELVGAGVGTRTAVADDDLAQPHGEALAADDLAQAGSAEAAPSSAARVRKSDAIGLATMTLGAVLHVAAVITRGIAAGRLPWANMYEFTLVGSAVAVVLYLLMRRRLPVDYLAAPLAGMAVLAIGIAQVLFYTAPDGVQPALQSYWLAIHVTIAVISTGVFTIGFIFTVLQLLAGRSFRGRLGRLVDALPSASTLEQRSFQFNAIGFVLWSFTLIAGAIWAEHAWGRYWGWDPKEVWTFVIWVVYAAYLHARTTRGWAGRRAALLAITGFVCVIINYTLVNLYFVGFHSYAQIPG